VLSFRDAPDRGSTYVSLRIEPQKSF
jgi:hypothetical protein